MRLSWEVDGVEIVVEKLEDGIEAGMEDAVEKILDNLEREAKNRIAIRPAVFTGEVYESFTDQTGSANVESGLSSRFINSAKHAGAVEHGVHPSKYAGGGPPIEALMPWVIAKLSDWNIDSDDSGGTSVKVPTAGDETESTNTIEDSTSGYQADWTRFHKNGFSADRMWNGQEVTVFDGTYNKYVSGTVDKIEKDQYGRTRVIVNRDDGTTSEYLINNGVDFDGTGIVVGEDWDSLDEETQRDEIKSLFRDIPIDSDFSNQWQTDIENAFDTWAENVKDVDKVKKFAHHIGEVRKNDSMGANGQWDEARKLMRFNTTQADKNTIYHEQGHAFAYANGRSYSNGARFDDDNDNYQGEEWDTTNMWGPGNSVWKYDEIGKDDWDTQPGDDFPHPSTYFMNDEDTRNGLSIYDDPNHDAFDHWEEYVRKDTKSKLQDVDDAGPPDYDPFFSDPGMVLKDGASAGPGDALGVKMTKSGKSKTFHMKVESKVYFDDEHDSFVIDVSQNGQDKTLLLNDDGTFTKDILSYDGYLPDGADDLGKSDSSIVDPEDVPDDPGFLAPESQSWEQFWEGINRQQWREMLADELSDSSQNPEWSLRSDQYSSINGQEIFAHFAAIMFAEDSNKGEAQNLIDLLDKNPELIYVASMEFNFSQAMKDALEKETGMSFDDLLFDIYRDKIQ